jgi:hypothetical protein
VPILVVEWIPCQHGSPHEWPGEDGKFARWTSQWRLPFNYPAYGGLVIITLLVLIRMLLIDTLGLISTPQLHFYESPAFRL